MNPKAIVPLVFIVATFAFAIAACAAPQLVNGDMKFYLVNFKYNGVTIVNEDIACKELRESSNAAAAFGIMACIFVGFAAVIAIVALVASFGAAKMVNMGLLVVVAAFSLISWAIEIHIYRDKFCGSALKDNGFNLHGGFACMIITTGLALISLVVTMVMGGGAAAAPAANAPSS